MSDRWEVRSTPAFDGLVIRDGWEPFAVTGMTVWLRRRVVAEPARQLLRGVLSETERAVLRRRSLVRAKESQS